MSEAMRLAIRDVLEVTNKRLALEREKNERLSAEVERLRAALRCIICSRQRARLVGRFGACRTCIRAAMMEVFGFEEPLTVERIAGSVFLGETLAPDVLEWVADDAVDSDLAEVAKAIVETCRPQESDD